MPWNVLFASKCKNVVSSVGSCHINSSRLQFSAQPWLADEPHTQTAHELSVHPWNPTKRMKIAMHPMPINHAGWWFQPLWKIWVKWDYCSQYMEKYKMFQTTNQHHTVKPSTRHFTKPRLQEMSWKVLGLRALNTFKWQPLRGRFCRAEPRVGPFTNRRMQGLQWD